MAAVLKSSMINASVSSPEAVTEGARRATGETASGAARPDPEVVATARRRQYSASEKRALLAGADEAKARGELGAFLRRKRIYSSMLSSWRKQVAIADRTALAPRQRGPKPDAAARRHPRPPRRTHHRAAARPARPRPAGIPNCRGRHSRLRVQSVPLLGPDRGSARSRFQLRSDPELTLA